jgi:hypothetical protein
MEKDFYRELISVKNNPPNCNTYFVLEKDERGCRLSQVDSNNGVLDEQIFGIIDIDLDR